MIKCEENQKIDGEELIKIFKISSINPFASYLKDIYRVHRFLFRIYYKEVMIN